MSSTGRDDLTDEQIDRIVTRETPRGPRQGRVCPDCGSDGIQYKLGGELGETYSCNACGYEGAPVFEPDPPKAP